MEEHESIVMNVDVQKIRVGAIIISFLTYYQCLKSFIHAY